MIFSQLGNDKKGFTIVELLVVIVVIGILAAITIVSYTNVQTRAQSASILSDLTQISKKIITYGSSSLSGGYSTLDVMPGGVASVSQSSSNYRYVSYCTNGSEFAYAVETNSGDKYYAKSNSNVARDDSINIFNPCNSLSISGASTTYLNLPAASCANENGTCTFTGTATIAYGYLPLGKFTAIQDLTSPVSCTNTKFGDPASGYGKKCYIMYQQD